MGMRICVVVLLAIFCLTVLAACGGSGPALVPGGSDGDQPGIYDGGSPGGSGGSGGDGGGYPPLPPIGGGSGTDGPPDPPSL